MAATAGKGCFVGPDRIGGRPAVGGDGVVGGVALVGAVGAVGGGLEEGHGRILARDVLHGRVARLAQGEGAAGVGDHLAVEADGHAAGGGLDGDRVVGSGLAHG